MGTISRKIAEEIMAGKYSEDEVTKIVTYNNMFDGTLTYAVVFAQDYQEKYEKSGACHNVKTIWTRDGGTA